VNTGEAMSEEAMKEGAMNEGVTNEEATVGDVIAENRRRRKGSL